MGKKKTGIPVVNDTFTIPTSGHYEVRGGWSVNYITFPTDISLEEGEEFTINDKDFVYSGGAVLTKEQYGKIKETKLGDLL